MNTLSDWQNFYVIAGSAAGALIGLQFVVLTLLSSLPRKVSMQGANVYSTPTIVHFTTVLLLSAVMVAPARGPVAHYAIAALIALGGLGGTFYSLRNARHMRHAGYKPQFEDWLFYTVLPLVAYALLAVSGATGFWLRFNEPGLYGTALSTILLLVNGIHNAWDTVTYHVFDRNTDI
jgi:hypothetical protein